MSTKEYKTITIMKKMGGCGNITLRFLEDEDAFHRVFITGSGGKMLCNPSWLEALSRLLTYALRRGIWEGTASDGIIKQLCNIRCNEIGANKEHICSCMDAVGKATKEYLKLE